MGRTDDDFINNGERCSEVRLKDVTHCDKIPTTCRASQWTNPHWSISSYAPYSDSATMRMSMYATGGGGRVTAEGFVVWVEQWCHVTPGGDSLHWTCSLFTHKQTDTIKYPPRHTHYTCFPCDSLLFVFLINLISCVQHNTTLSLHKLFSEGSCQPDSSLKL